MDSVREDPIRQSVVDALLRGEPASALTAAPPPGADPEGFRRLVSDCRMFLPMFRAQVMAAEREQGLSASSIGCSGVCDVCDRTLSGDEARPWPVRWQRTKVKDMVSPWTGLTILAGRVTVDRTIETNLWEGCHFLCRGCRGQINPGCPGLLALSTLWVCAYLLPGILLLAYGYYHPEHQAISYTLGITVLILSLMWGSRYPRVHFYGGFPASQGYVPVSVEGRGQSCRSLFGACQGLAIGLMVLLVLGQPVWPAVSRLVLGSPTPAPTVHPANAALNEARRAFRQKDYYTAEMNASEAVRSLAPDPSKKQQLTEARGIVAESFYQRKKYPEALERYRELTRIAPQNKSYRARVQELESRLKKKKTR